MMQQMFISHILLSAETIKMTTVKVVVVGELPKKPLVDHPVPAVLKPLVLPEDLRVMQALDRVLRLLSVGSKRFLWLLWLLWLVTNKVGRG